ncbi:hypothetical protein FS837_001563 [Tulasnella sp. UAMH 9824]|nr:hypothetical protein FS837_001563 [Tulasnella sp. UAMH 9824]
MLLPTLFFLAQALVSALAAPVLNERASVTAASASVVSSFTPYIQFARAAYCTEDSIVVAHEGTDPTQFLSLVNDADFFPDAMDQAYFPGISSSILVHGGFQDTFKRSASSILAAVKKVMAAKSSSKVTLVGHSLGGALALLDTVYLKIQIPSITTKTVTLGGPRVGNPAFASYLGSFDLTRITHELDPIPIVPGRGLGFAHPQGEVHQSSADDKWYNCPGSDNTDLRCSTGNVLNIFLSDIVDHLGPYNNLWVGTIYC